MEISINNNLKIAKKVVLQAASFFSKNKKNFNVLEQEIDREVKLLADLELNDFIINKLQIHSSLPIFSEEKKQDFPLENNFTWVLDPLDGSYNFLRGIPHYCISLGLSKGYEPILGVLYDLINNDIYFGSANSSAYKNKTKIYTSNKKSFSDSVLCTGFPVNYKYSNKKIIDHFKLVRNFKKIRLFGSAGISLACLSTGIVDAYCEENIMFWDIAGGIAILKAAGGEVRLSKGDVLHSFNVQATNGGLYFE